MDLETKLKYAANHIDSIARHSDVTEDERNAVLDRVIKYAQDAKATVKASPLMPPKMAIGTDEAALRQKIADVQALMAAEKDPERRKVLEGLERAFGAMLPPISGTLNIGAAQAQVQGKA